MITCKNHDACRSQLFEMIKIKYRKKVKLKNAKHVTDMQFHFLSPQRQFTAQPLSIDIIHTIISYRRFQSEVRNILRFPGFFTDLFRYFIRLLSFS